MLSAAVVASSTSAAAGNPTEELVPSTQELFETTEEQEFDDFINALEPGEDLIFYAPELEEIDPDSAIFDPDNVVWEDESAGEGDRLTPNLNPWTIARCNLGHSDVVVQTMGSKYNKNVQLKCGNEKSGYNHIRKSHKDNWNAKRGAAYGNWDDYMVWAAGAALKAPSISVSQSGNKRCYVTPIKVKASSGRISTFYARVAVSKNNQTIITAFPQKRNHCGVKNG